MSGLRGFGFTFENGHVRNWYVGADGVQRWADNDQPVETPVDSTAQHGSDEG